MTDRDTYRLETWSGREAARLVDPFYEKGGFQGRARAGDVFFLAFCRDQLIGAVRFCRDEGTPMLRTMMIDEKHRRQGAGRTLLALFAQYVDARGVRNIYCLPYAHLEIFYGSIGFKRVPPEGTPPFLEARLTQYQRPGEGSICMRRL